MHTRRNNHAHEQPDDDLDVSNERGSKQFSKDDSEEDDQSKPQIDTMPESQHYFSIPAAGYFGSQHLAAAENASAPVREPGSNERTSEKHQAGSRHNWRKHPTQDTRRDE